MNCRICKLEFENSKSELPSFLFHVIVKHGDVVNNEKDFDMYNAFTFPQYENKKSFGSLEDLV